MSAGAERDSYDPDFYELVHRGNPGDVEFYLSECAGADRVLELGCGYGRVSVALARAGHHVTALDIHGGLLEKADHARAALPPVIAERLELVYADMCELTLGRRFDRIVIPFGGLYCLLSDEQRRACLSSVASHLAPNGRLVFDGYSADAFHAESADAEAELEFVVTVMRWGALYDVFESSHWDREQQRLSVSYTHQPRAGGDSVVGTIEQRYLLSHEVPPLLARAGLSVTGMWGDFKRSDWSADSEFLVVRALPSAGLS